MAYEQQAERGRRIKFMERPQDIVVYPSKVCGGKTVILPTTGSAIACGRGWLEESLSKLNEFVESGSVPVKTKKKVKGKTVETTELKPPTPLTMTALSSSVRDGLDGVASFTSNLAGMKDIEMKFEACVYRIIHGTPEARRKIAEWTQRLHDLTLKIQPSLAPEYAGFERWEDGDEVELELLRQGDDRPFLRRAQKGKASRKTKGDGAYRIVINTDLEWWGSPTLNAGLMGAMVLLLQNFGPVEVWIQQGWLGGNPHDGVALFKLDFECGFDPTQLSFWCGDQHRDGYFSMVIARALGRRSSGRSQEAEIPCDLYMQGDWMEVWKRKFGLESDPELSDLHSQSNEYLNWSQDKKDKLEKAMAGFLAAACQSIVFEDEALEVA